MLVSVSKHLTNLLRKCNFFLGDVAIISFILFFLLLFFNSQAEKVIILKSWVKEGRSFLERCDASLKPKEIG